MNEECTEKEKYIRRLERGIEDSFKYINDNLTLLIPVAYRDFTGHLLYSKLGNIYECVADECKLLAFRKEALNEVRKI